jgi:hypothetical protein
MLLIGALVWLTLTVMAYSMIFTLFNMQPMHPATRRTAIALAVVALTARIIRTEMGDNLDQFWGHMPLAQSMWITMLFGFLADMGAPYLIIVGSAVIMIDITWIVDNWATLGVPLY